MPGPEIIAVLILLAVLIGLLILEPFTPDVSAMLILMALGATCYLPFLPKLLEPDLLFSGFSSQAVVALVGIMVIASAIDRTGILHPLALWISRLGKQSAAAKTALLSLATGSISAIIQNLGAAALCMPLANRIAAHGKIPLQQLLMPMGFAAILGGSITMIGAGPLILLNDLIPRGMEPFHLLDVAPLGLTLLLSGLAYWALFHKWLLPEKLASETSEDIYRETYGVDPTYSYWRWPAELDQMPVGELENRFGCHVIAIATPQIRLSPHREVCIPGRATIAVLSTPQELKKLQEHTSAVRLSEHLELEEALSPANAGFAELVVPPASPLIGNTIREIRIRRSYGITPLAIHRGDTVIKSNLRDCSLGAGDSILCHIQWMDLANLEESRNFTVITRDFPHITKMPEKAGLAWLWLAIGFGATLFGIAPTGYALLLAAIGMVASGILSMEDAYRAISWKTVFLLAALIPLGVAVADTGTAEWIANQGLALLGSEPAPVLIFSLVAFVGAALGLMMSNLGAAVVLVPLAAQLGVSSGVDARLLVLVAAVSVSHVFALPTQQVNALIMGPGGFSTRDFIRAGSGLTLLAIVITIAFGVAWV
ncbi:SLC13 family permease [Biformimicrobium ophioploci]|uniref:SLC13 family permease n=1 Tax=Biformimicrobium ophioploci TaxID=3036711 RepID=A0ABQ6M1V2_9GAMM|nr:SLC13 family permease [Microbulbifer sp. NKW57]GMG88334.1 SLC13 family permease [Microbulbifer sp. NKW57]